MTPEARKGAAFELLAFTAAPVTGALVVIELEGRFAGAQAGRFTRHPVLVIEADDRPRLELAPVRAELHDAYWRGAYAIPAEARPGARFALGLRGTLLELPAPDEADDTERLATLAREANTLRRALEDTEATVAIARAEADTTSAELGTAVLAARDGALAESADRIAEASARADAAEARALAAEKAAHAAESGTEVLRAELAEERARFPTAIAAPTQIAPVATASTPPHTSASRGPGPWIAVTALVLFAIVLLALLLG